MKNIIYYKDKQYKGYIIYMPMYAKCEPYKVKGTFYEWEENGKRGLYHIEKSTHYNENGIQKRELKGA